MVTTEELLSKGRLLQFPSPVDTSALLIHVFMWKMAENHMRRYVEGEPR